MSASAAGGENVAPTSAALLLTRVKPPAPVAALSTRATSALPPAFSLTSEGGGAGARAGARGLSLSAGVGPPPAFSLSLGGESAHDALNTSGADAAAPAKKRKAVDAQRDSAVDAAVPGGGATAAAAGGEAIFCLVDGMRRGRSAAHAQGVGRAGAGAGVSRGVEGVAARASADMAMGDETEPSSTQATVLSRAPTEAAAPAPKAPAAQKARGADATKAARGDAAAAEGKPAAVPAPAAATAAAPVINAPLVLSRVSFASTHAGLSDAAVVGSSGLQGARPPLAPVEGAAALLVAKRSAVATALPPVQLGQSKASAPVPPKARDGKAPAALIAPLPSTHGTVTGVLKQLPQPQASASAPAPAPALAPAPAASKPRFVADADEQQDEAAQAAEAAAEMAERPRAAKPRRGGARSVAAVLENALARL